MAQNSYTMELEQRKANVRCTMMVTRAGFIKLY